MTTRRTLGGPVKTQGTSTFIGVVALREKNIMGNRLRVRYYDLFSHFYDKFVQLHSGDPSKKLRYDLARKACLSTGETALDICTGTGALLPNLQEHVGREGLIVGLDFSRGMLIVARRKVSAVPNITLVQADAVNLPFRNQVFGAVTCSHAFYELEGDAPARCLRDVVRVLSVGSRFLMMEHDVPKNWFVRILFYIRIFSMGRRKGLEILRSEDEQFRQHFGHVRKLRLNSGRTKLIIGVNSDSRQPRSGHHTRFFE